MTRAWDLPGGAAFEVDLGALAEIPAGAHGYRAVSTFPAVVQDIAVVVDDDVPAADVEAAVREAGGELLERLRLFDVYRGEQVGEGSKSLALRLEFRAPDRTLTDEEVGRAARTDRERARRAGREAPWLASPSSERPDSPARCARRSSSAIRGSSSTWSPRAATPAACSRTSTRATASTASSRHSTPTALPRRATPRSSRTRTARRRRRSRSCATRGLKVVDLSADFRVPLELYERWYGPHPAPKLLDEAVYGLTELNRDEIRDAEPRRRAGLLPDRGAARAAAAEGDRERDVRRREVGRVGRGPRGDGDHALRVGRRERRRPTRSRATATRRSSTRTSARRRSCRTCCRSTRG